jgi:hypothetical protein
MLFGACLAAALWTGGCVSAPHDASSSTSSTSERQSSVDLRAREARSLSAFLGVDPERRLDLLPLRGDLESVPWASSYWPDSLGGIARRWREVEVGKSVYFGTPTREFLRGATPEEIAKLSPAEKIDLLAGRYDFPTLKAVREKARFLVPDWAGICDGVALASTTFAEPDAVTLTNPDGLAVSFGSSDVKALVSHAAENVDDAKLRQLGARCDAFEPKELTAPCLDVGAADFHLALTHRIGRERKPLMADVTWDAMVWNHSFYSFESVILARGAPTMFGYVPAPGVEISSVSSVARVRTLVRANNFKVKEHWFKADAGDRATEETYFYLLALDASGRIVDGSWESYERPDFLWLTTEPPRIDDPVLARLFEASVGRQPPATAIRN